MARSSSRSPSPRSENGERGRRSRRTSRQSQYRSRSKGESPSPPATEKRERDTPSPLLKHEQRSRSSKSRSVSSSSRSSAVKYGAAQLNQSQSSLSSSVKEYSGSQSKVSLKDPVKIVQVANIAPRATREQMQALFGYVGKIDDIRLYPAVDVAWQFQSKVCFIKFHDAKSVGNAQHLTNTIFIDRVLIVIPYMDGDIPDEGKAVELLTSGSLLPGKADPKLPQHVTSQLEGIPPHQVVITKDPRLVERNLPSYPPLSPTFDSRKIEEIRRTIMVCNLEQDISEEDVIEYFSRAGEVKYFRFCTRDNDPLKFALIEFSEQPAILDALTLNGETMGEKVIRVHHATQAIIKPQAKSNEAAQKEIEEAMSRQAQNLLTSLDSTVAPFVKDKRRSKSRSRRTSRCRRSVSGTRRHTRSRSRSPHSSSRNRERYHSKTKKSRSRSRDKRTSRSRRRSKSGGRSGKSRSISHSRRSRSKKPEEKKKPKKDKDREKERNTEKDHKENVDGIDPPIQKEKRRKSDRKSRSPKSESKKRRSRSGSHSRKMSSPGHEKKRSKSKKKKKSNSDREPSMDSRSSSKEKRPKKERSESLEREVTTRDSTDSKKGYLAYR